MFILNRMASGTLGPCLRCGLVWLASPPTKNPEASCDISGFSSRQKQTASCKHRRGNEREPLGIEGLMVGIKALSSKHSSHLVVTFNIPPDSQNV